MYLNIPKSIRTAHILDKNAHTRQPGSGITARELAVVLQSGAVDDDILSEAVILDDVVESRIENVSSENKAAYMQILLFLVARFTDVENRGYSPPIDNVLSRDNTITMTDNASGGNETSSSVVSLFMHQRAREKKKQHQQTNTKSPVPMAAVTSSLPGSKSMHSASNDDDLTDPVAVALLGMGFAGDQIKSAARALGGFERATADDMVMWILCGGENVDCGSATDQDNDVTTKSTKIDPNHETEMVNPPILCKTQKNAAVRAKRDSEEAARKRLEEQAAAKRAVEKREEQRRIRWEWNEREQERQELEKNARMVEALERRKQADIEKSISKTSALPTITITEVSGGVGMPPSAVHHIPVNAGGGSSKHHHRNTDSNGPPLTIIAGGPKIPSSKSKTAASNMGIPQAPTLRAPKILTRPSSTPAGILTCATGSVHSQETTIGPGNLPLLAPVATFNPTPALYPSRSILRKTCNQSTSQHLSSFHKRHHPPLAILQKTSSAGAPHPNVTSTSRIKHDATTSTVNDSAPLIQNEFFGTGTILAPPGFFSGSCPPEKSTTDSVTSAYIETNHLGLIRATAREFVPTSFKLTASHVASNNAASMSAQSVHAPFANLAPSVSNDHSDNLISDCLPVSSFGDDRSTPPASLVPIIGNKGDYTVPSVASFITGVSGVPAVAEENAASRVGSIMMFESIPSSDGAGAADGIQTPSILESFAFGGGKNSSSALGSGGIWGGGNDVNPLGLAGLNLSSFLGSGVTANHINQGDIGASRSDNWGKNTGGDSIW